MAAGEAEPRRQLSKPSPPGLHLRELKPTQRVAHVPDVTPLAGRSGRFSDVLAVTFELADGRRVSIAEYLHATEGDGLLILHRGDTIAEMYSSDMQPHTAHTLMSITRSFIGSVTSILVERGQLAMDTPVEMYAPELRDTGFAGATVRQLLDMRSGVTSSLAQLLHAVEWGSSDSSKTDCPAPDGIVDTLLQLPRQVPHGGPFKYRWADTDMLGYLCQRVTGRNMSELISELVWVPIGAVQDADMLVDRHRTAMCSGGLCTTLRDAGRYGLMWLNDGTTDGRQVIPRSFVEDTRHGSEDARRAFCGDIFGIPLPGGMFRNQMWNVDHVRGTSLMFGANGQIILIDPPAKLVLVLFSHWSMPFIPDRAQGWLSAMRAIVAHLPK